MGDLIDRDRLKANLICSWNEEDDHDFANKSVWEALAEAPAVHPLKEEDYIEIRDRFGEFAEFVVRDMIQGDGQRWAVK